MNLYAIDTKRRRAAGLDVWTAVNDAFISIKIILSVFYASNYRIKELLPQLKRGVDGDCQQCSLSLNDGLKCTTINGTFEPVTA